MDEEEKIEHQLELTTRVAGTVNDESTVQRLRRFADELRYKLRRLKRWPQVRARAYELWEEAGRLLDAISSFGWKPSGRSGSAWMFEGTHKLNRTWLPPRLRRQAI
jgi:hypothetical protein